MFTKTARPGLFAAGAALILGLVLWATVARSPRPAKSRLIRVLALSSVNRALAAGTPQGTILACVSQDPLNCRTFEADGSLNDLQFTVTGELIIADRNIRLATLDQGPPRLVRSDGANYGVVRFAPDSRTILTINGKGVVMTVDLYTGLPSPAYCCSSIWGDVAFIDHGQAAVWAGHWPGIWDFSSGKLLGRLTAQREFMTFGPIAIDPRRGLAYMGSQDGFVYRWNLASREFVSKSPPLSGYVMTVIVLGESGWIAYASQPGVVHLWNPETGDHRAVELARTSSNLVFDPQRGLVAFGTESGTVAFWDLPRGRLVEKRPLFE